MAAVGIEFVFRALAFRDVASDRQMGNGARDFDRHGMGLQDSAGSSQADHREFKRSAFAVDHPLM